MNRAKLQLDTIGDFHRLSLGKFTEAIPRSSPVFNMLSFLVGEVGGWESTQAILVGHWADEITASGWRRVLSFSYRWSLFRPSKVELSEVPTRRAFLEALECSWRLPRLLLCVVDRANEHALTSMQPSRWRAVFDDEVPHDLLSLRLPMLVLGFYHQQWISAYVPHSRAITLARDLLTTFGEGLVHVRDEL